MKTLRYAPMPWRIRACVPRLARWGAIALLLAGALGCRTTFLRSPPPAPPPAPAPTAAPKLPAEVDAELRPSLELPRAGARERGDERFDVAVHEAPARRFFLDLVAGSPYDVVVHPGVSGSVTLTMRGVTVPEVLEAVRSVYGYGFRETPGGFQILPAEIQSRVFHVNYLHLAREGVSRTRVSSGQLSDQFSETRGTRDGGVGPVATGGNRQTVLESSEVRTDSRTDLWEELRLSLLALVGEGEGHSVVVSPQAGIVIVRARPDALQQVAAYLSSAERSLNRQVVIEAKILEIELADGYQTGVNWGALIQSGLDRYLIGQTGGGRIFSDGVSEIAGNLGDLDPSMPPGPPANTDTSAFGGVFSAALQVGDFDAFIELLETQGDVRVLSSPRVSTTNNQKAVIKVGSDEFFVTDVSTTTVTGTVATTSPEVTLTPFFSGIALDVLPQISAEGDVILHVHPAVSQVQDQRKIIQLFGETLDLPLALSTIRESDSIVRARSGQVVVIGGLMQERRLAERASIPLLGRIPGLGWAFGQRRGATVNSELVILLRPRVVEGGDFGPELGRVGGDGKRGVAREWLGRNGWGSP